MSATTGGIAVSTPAVEGAAGVEPWVSVATAAGAFEVSTRTVQRMVAAGAVPVLKIGRATRVRVSDIEKACTLFPAVNL